VYGDEENGKLSTLSEPNRYKAEEGAEEFGDFHVWKALRVQLGNHYPTEMVNSAEAPLFQ
jgi:hypothetical protein